MFTAKEKRGQNIAEYLLYMWQIEDLIRANDLDIDKIDAAIISQYASLTDEQRDDLRQWYEGLIDMMRREGKVASGHLQINKNTLIRIVDLHQQLLKSAKFPDYTAEFYRTLPFIVELRAKSGEEKSGEIETCFNALYGIIMLRLTGKEITPDTAIALKQITKFVAMLSAYFMKNEVKSLFDDDKDE